MTVLISGHDLAGLEALCDRALLLSDGQIAGEVALSGSPKRLYRLRFSARARAEEVAAIFSGDGAVCSGTEVSVLWSAEEFRAALLKHSLDFTDLRVGGELEYRFLEKTP